MDELRDVQSRTEAFLLSTQRVAPQDGLMRAATAQSRPPFSPFRNEDLEAALRVAATFASISDQLGGGAVGLAAVVDEATRLAESDDPALARYALQLFITRHPEGNKLRIPSLRDELRAKGGELRAKRPRPSPGNELARGLADAPPRPDDESKMEFFRFDPDLNDHHRHWHLLYTGNNPIEGELFFYMHEQMLARYETERYALRLSPAVPYAETDDGFKEILPPFVPPTDIVQQGYAPRPAGAATDYAGSSQIPVMSQYAAKIAAGLANGAFPTINDLGNEVEAMHGLGYSGLHNAGHGIISTICTSTGEMNVMGDPAFAMMDPVFYRWHTRVDRIAQSYMAAKDPHDFADAPNVSIRKNLGGAAAHSSPDIILCRYEAINPTHDPNFDYGAYGERSFGSAKWNADPSENTDVTYSLRTKLSVANFLQFEDHFVYFIRAANGGSTPCSITVRLFLCALDLIEQRTRWIELDKFKHLLAPDARTVIARPGWFSTSIRQAEVPVTLQPRAEHDPGPDGNYCDCGLPYNMIVPRGAPGGMPFVLFAMLSDGYDQADPDSACGSISYCGRKQQQYPDKRPMGYPFDRPWKTSIADGIAVQSTMATRQITITPS